MIEAINLTKSFNNEIIISDFNIKIKKGDFIAITGESGSGKTTLLNLLGLLEKSDSGNLIVDGLHNPSRKEESIFQRYKFGYLFQNYALIENATVAENLKIALEYKKNIDKKTLMKEALHFVNLNNSFLEKKIYQLSGGEQQRVAIARLYLKDADYIFADEPTGNLDLKNRDIIFKLLKNLNRTGKTVILVTHDLELVNKTDKCIRL